MAYQVEIKYMINALKEMSKKLGGDKAKRALAGTQFDFIQEEFLAKRHRMEKMLDEKEREGVTSKNADLNFRIREGIKELKELLTRMQDELKRLTKKKKDTVAVLQKKKKIVDNCELLYQGISQRISQQNPNTGYNKPMTLTDMKAKLLEQIDINSHQIHKQTSEDRFTEPNEQQLQAMEKYKQADEEIDDALDEVIDGLGRVRAGVHDIVEKQDGINQRVEDNKRRAEKLSKRIETDNQKLKKIIQNFKPNRCCLAIVLLLLFIGLVVVAVKLAIQPDSNTAT